MFLRMHTSAEIAEYLGWLRHREWHPAWRQAGTVAAAVRNSAGGKSGGQAFTTDEFIPMLPAERTRLRQEELEHNLVAIMAVPHGKAK